MMGIIALLSLALLLTSISFRRPAHSASGKAEAGTGTAARQAVFIGIFFAYLLALPYGGYILCTLLYLLSNMFWLGKRETKWYVVYAASTVLITALVYFIFAKMMLLFLP
jgi:hypothetical protein